MESDIQPPPPKKSGVPRSGYQHATKIRAAISNHFGRGRKLGRQQWTINEEDGTTSGNPSLAPSLADYMLSLQRRKVYSIHSRLSFLSDGLQLQQVRAGEQPTSARAITSDILKELYEYNTEFSGTHSVEAITPRGDPFNWANAHTRCMLHFCYLLAFWCFLRFDEALNIEFHQVQLKFDDQGIAYLEIQLPWRKTHQLGSKHRYSYYLHFLLD